MRLQFVNKNSGKIYEVAEGANISMSYNEDLSHGTILVRENSKIDIEPYDEIILLDLDYTDKLYMLVDSYVEKETRNRTGDKIYTYEIKVMSQTKLLENKILPSLSITPKTNNGKSIYQYLTLYNDLYGQKVREENTKSLINKFSFNDVGTTEHPSVATKFASICPELQFNNPTFRECLTQLMMVKNCIPIVQNNVIDYIDLSEKNRHIIDEKNIAYTTTSQESSDYISDIRMNMKNVIQDEQYIETTEYIGFRNDSSSVITDKNMKLYTQQPIYDIVNFEILFWYKYLIPVSSHQTRSEIRFCRQDLNNFDGHTLINEKSKFLTLNVASSLDSSNWRNFYEYQNSTVYYTRGDNKIENWDLATRLTFLSDFKQSAFTLITNACAMARKPDDPNYTINSKTYDNAMEVMFKITYKTKSNVAIKIGKSHNQTTEREVVDNQSQNYVNAYTQGLLEYAKANRLGNKLKTKYGRYERKDTNMPVIGDYFGDNEIIYKADYQLNRNCVDATYYVCPNYVLRNYFTGVQSKLRSWKIVDGNEAFYREDIYKYYFEFSYSEYTDSMFNLGVGFIRNISPNLLLNATRFTNDDEFKIRTFMIMTSSLAVPYRYFLETAKNVCGNSVVFTCGYRDNFSLGQTIDYSFTTGGTGQKYARYTGDTGTVGTVDFFAIKNLNLKYTFPSDKEELTTQAKIDEVTNKIKETQGENPGGWGLFNRNDYFEFANTNYNKDNKEIPTFNFQFEYCTDGNIVLGDEFIKMHINNSNNRSKLKIKLSNTPINGQIIPPDTDGEVVDFNITQTVASSNVSSNIKVNDTKGYKYSYIFNNESKKLVLAFENKENGIYLNFLQSRNK